MLRAWLWLAICVDAVSTCLYLFLPAGTVVYFGGVASPTATFWCTTAATGDSVSALWCLSALRANSARELRDAARGLLLFSVVHLGAFVHGHYFIERLTGGASYAGAMLAGMALGTWFGFLRPVQVPGAEAGAGRAGAGRGAMRAADRDAQPLLRSPRMSAADALPARRIASPRAGSH